MGLWRRSNSLDWASLLAFIPPLGRTCLGCFAKSDLKTNFIRIRMAATQLWELDLYGLVTSYNTVGIF